MYLSNCVGAQIFKYVSLKSASAALFMLVAAVSGLFCSIEPASAQGGDSFFGSLFGNGADQRRSYSSGSRYGRSGFGSWLEPDEPMVQHSSRFRTLCVRTCDGFYFPISFSTTQSGLARDAQQCQARCGAPAKLFYHRNPGADVQHMVDLRGQPYSSLQNAFRYREEVVDSCRCTPQPWSEAAKQEYDRRAELEENPELAKTATAAAKPQTAPDARAEVAGWRSDTDIRPVAQRRTRSRTRYRASDPALEGRWWAGSW